MSIPYFAMYPTDFDGKTAHLSLAEDGAYNRLLRLQWTSPGCKMPADPAWIMRKMRATSEADKAVVQSVLKEFFTRKGRFYFSQMLLDWCERHRKSQSRTWVPLDVQRAVWARDGQKCRYCGATSGPFHLDHVVPWRLGGPDTAENLTVACAPCNWGKGGKTLEEWAGPK